MSNIIIANAIIKDWDLKLNRDGQFPNIDLHIHSVEGEGIIRLDNYNPNDILRVLKINSLKNLAKVPCVVLIEDKIMRTIGNFLYQTYCFIEHDWIDAEIYKDKIISAGNFNTSN
jgi:hypothetical protein